MDSNNQVRLLEVQKIRLGFSKEEDWKTIYWRVHQGEEEEEDEKGDDKEDATTTGIIEQTSASQEHTIETMKLSNICEKNHRQHIKLSKLTT